MNERTLPADNPVWVSTRRLVVFCISEIPVCKLLQQNKGYRMREPTKRNASRTHSLFVNDLKEYEEIYKVLKNVNETIFQASHYPGASYGVSECEEVVF